MSRGREEGEGVLGDVSTVHVLSYDHSGPWYGVVGVFASAVHARRAQDLFQQRKEKEGAGAGPKGDVLSIEALPLYHARGSPYIPKECAWWHEWWRTKSRSLYGDRDQNVWLAVEESSHLSEHSFRLLGAFTSFDSAALATQNRVDADEFVQGYCVVRRTLDAWAKDPVDFHADPDVCPIRPCAGCGYVPAVPFEVQRVQAMMADQCRRVWCADSGLWEWMPDLQVAYVSEGAVGSPARSEYVVNTTIAVQHASSVAASVPTAHGKEATVRYLVQMNDPDVVRCFLFWSLGWGVEGCVACPRRRLLCRRQSQLRRLANVFPVGK
jgi:hypothetical protein